MKRSLFMLLMLILMLGFMTVRAQETEPIPWPPDPAQIFVPGVEVVESEVYEVENVDDDISPVIDNDARTIRVYDTTTEQSYTFSFPDTLEGQVRIEWRRDGSYVVSQDDPNEDRLTAAWMLDAATGEFTPLMLVCNGRIPALEGEGTWHYVTENEQTYLCFTETGEQNGPLSSDTNWYIYPDYTRPIETSPDRDWLVLMTANGEYPDDYFEYYSYEIDSERLIYLGRVDMQQGYTYPPHFSEWVSDTRGTIFDTQPPESSPDNYYGFDITIENSLDLIVNGWLYNFYYNPLRYEYVTTKGFFEWKTGAFVPGGSLCNLLIFDAQGTRNYELGYDCIGARIVRKDYGYFMLRVDSAESETSTLIRLDPQTGTILELGSAEYEWLHDIFADGRYALVVMNDNGRIDLTEYYPMFDEYDLSSLENEYLAIVELGTNRIIFDTRGLVSNWDIGLLEAGSCGEN